MYLSDLRLKKLRIRRGRRISRNLMTDDIEGILNRSLIDAINEREENPLQCNP